MKRIKYYTSDIETDGLYGKFIVGVIYDGKNYKVYDNVLSYTKAIININGNVWFHFGIRYDVNYIIKAILDNISNVEIELIETKSNVVGIKIGKTMIHDFSYILRMSLEKIAKKFNISHRYLDMKKQRDNISSKSIEDIVNYCKEDCKVLYEIIKQLIDVFGISIHKKFTIASISLSIFRKYYAKKTFFQGYADRKEYDDIRNGYFGARNEIFEQKYTGHGYIYDINSMYPYIMLYSYIPIGKPYLIKKFSNKYPGIYYVDIEVPEEELLPYACVRYDNYLIFPSGRIRTWLWDFEFKYCQVKKIHYGYIFFRKEKVFERFISEYYEKRKIEKEEGLRAFYKLIMNSLYGKFGQRKDIKKRIIKSITMEDFKNSNNSISFRYNEEIINEDKIRDYMMPHISAFITAKGRELLYNYIRLDFENVIYCDTDSIFVKNNNSYLKYISPEIGYFKEEDMFEEIYILCEKMYAYRFGNRYEIVARSIPILENEKKYYFEIFKNQHKNLIETGKFNITKKEEKFLGFLSYFKRLNNFSEKSEVKKCDYSTNLYIIQEKEINDIFLKRRISKDSIKTIPYIIYQW